MSTQIQQNSFNPMFDNSEILMMRHFWRVVPRLEALLLPEKKCTSETSRSRGYIRKGLQESVRTSTVVVSPDLLSPTPSTVVVSPDLLSPTPSTVVVSPDLLSPTPLTSSAMKTPENTEEESDDPAPADERDV